MTADPYLAEAAPLAQDTLPEIPLFEYKVDPKTPDRDLLPTPPKVIPPPEPYAGNDPANAALVALAEPVASTATFTSGLRQLSATVTKIRHLDGKKRNGFLKVLLEHRPDLRGLPFLTGPDAALWEGNLAELAETVAGVRTALENRPQFWKKLKLWAVDVDFGGKKGKVAAIQSLRSRVAVLQEVLATEPGLEQADFVAFLETIPHADATRALARLAVFHPNAGTAQAALAALRLRRAADYNQVFVQALRYPWPEAARRAGAALAALQSTAVIPGLVDLLDAPDPRLPRRVKNEGKEAWAAAQLVRLNHELNCLLCHAPAPKDRDFPKALTGTVSLPCRPLPTKPYGHLNVDALVRADVTYLRSDFSRQLPVANAAPWPPKQRFDFLVRQVPLSEAQAKIYEAKLLQQIGGQESPYRTVVLTTLRSLTGRDAGTTTAEWRKALKLPG